MPLTLPTLDNRRYPQLLEEALARIPIHNPEWTNFNESDPGVTLIELFAFLTENLLYRANQIPERNRRKFLSLLGVPLQPASAARGLVTFHNERGPLQTLTFNADLEVRAGSVPFRTEAGLDVLPIETQVFYKSELHNAPPEVRDHYVQLYASWRDALPDASQLHFYETRPLVTRATGGVDLGQGQDTLDGSLWMALLVRPHDKPYPEKIEEARDALGGKTLNLGLAPYFDTPQRTLPPGASHTGGENLLQYQLPKILPNGRLPDNPSGRVAEYQTLATSEVPIEPTVIQITLPPADQLKLWSNFDPLESGVGDFPPNLEDTALNERLITWLRIVAPPSAQFKVMWAGLNAVLVNQRAHVANEPLPDGTGEPDQTVTLAQTPVLPGTVRVTVTLPTGEEHWTEIDDLFAAGPEVPAPDLRQPPGLAPASNPLLNVFSLDPEAGTLRFGDGAHGRRPPRGAILRAAYDYGVGRAGNVGVGVINTSPALLAGIKVTNPLRTWHGAEAETIGEGEKQIARYLQHRDRLVSAIDFETITRRTPGVDLGRVDVLPTFNPKLSSGQWGAAPGAVTLMLVPKYDAAHPDTPEPDPVFLNAVCAYLDPRRLVTTEVFLRGPSYKAIWISVGFKAVAGASVATGREAIKQALYNFLSPLPNPNNADPERGWPLLKPVVDRELLAVASRVRDVSLIKDVIVAEGSQAPNGEISMTGLELPRIAGLAISLGDPIPIDQLRGQPTPTDEARPDAFNFKPVPVIPEECS